MLGIDGGAPVIEFACPSCRAALAFAPAQAGMTGPCYRCGATVTVPVPPPPGPIEVAPSASQHSVAGTVANEALAARLVVVGSKVVQIAQGVTTGENVGNALKARFLFGASIRVDRVQAIKLQMQDGFMMLVIPWSGNMMLAHELASVLPGTLQSNLWLSRGALGAWSSGRYTGTHGGEGDPVAVAADKEYELNSGIEWDWDSGRMRIKLDWGLQAVSAGNDRTLHVMHTAQRGIFIKDFGLVWYLERRAAFGAFIGKGRVHPSQAQEPYFTHEPFTTMFLDGLL